MMNHNGGPDRAAKSLLRRQLTRAKRIEVVLKPLRGYRDAAPASGYRNVRVEEA
jgi:hypothetical protein